MGPCIGLRPKASDRVKARIPSNEAYVIPDSSPEPDIEVTERERFLTGVIDAVPAMVAYWDSAMHCRFANKAYLAWFGKSPETVIGSTIRKLLGEELFALNEPFIRGALAGRAQTFERTLTKADGSIGYTLANYIPDVDEQGAVQGFAVLVSDVTPLKEAEAKLRIAASIINNTAEGVIVTDADGAILSANTAFATMTGYTGQELLGKPASDIQVSFQDPEFIKSALSDSRNGQWSGEGVCRRKNGSIFPVWQSINTIEPGEGGPARYASILIDVTHQWQENERIQHLALHDALTDLPNRYLLLERLSQLCSIAERERRPIAVLFLDLDGLKGVNDTFGHEAGDLLLKMVAARLQRRVRHTDTVARLGGDEFVVLLDNAANKADVARLAATIVERINEPIKLHGETVHVGCSVGIALNPEDGTTPAELIAIADRAMYKAKARGGSCFVFGAELNGGE